MRERKANESVEQFAIRTAWELGHFWNPDNPEGMNVRQEDLAKLSASDPVVIKALQSLSKINVTSYAESGLDVYGRLPEFDGILGPALKKMLESLSGRCPVPDYAPPEGVSFSFDDPWLQQVVEVMQSNRGLPDRMVANGNWPRCHNIGDAHCASVRVDESLMPAHVRRLFPQIITKVQKAYADIGLLFRFIAPDGRDYLNGEEWNSSINIKMSFVRSSSGWIGLAIVGQGQMCDDQIWCQYLASYQGGTTDADIITQWVTLIMHELGHNCGLSHSSGGVMNPSLITGLPGLWLISDPSTPLLKRKFSGVPVAIPGGPKPPVPPDKPDDLRTELNDIHFNLALQRAQVDWCVKQIRKRGVL